MISDRGPVYYGRIDNLGESGKLALVRLKARGLLVPRNVGEGYYKYDITPLGKEVLEVHMSTQQSPRSGQSNGRSFSFVGENT